MNQCLTCADKELSLLFFEYTMPFLSQCLKTSAPNSLFQLSSLATVSYIILFISFMELTEICDLFLNQFTHKLSISSTGMNVLLGQEHSLFTVMHRKPTTMYLLSFKVTFDLLATDRPILETKFLIAISSFHQNTVYESPSMEIIDRQ